MAADGGLGVSDADPVVLVVSDEREAADRYAEQLERAVEIAADVEEGIDAVDDGPVVALVDRRPADADRLVDHFEERNVNYQGVLLAADDQVVAPGEFGLLVEPVSREALIHAVEVVALWVRYDELLEAYYALAADRA